MVPDPVSNGIANVYSPEQSVFTDPVSVISLRAGCHGNSGSRRRPRAALRRRRDVSHQERDQPRTATGDQRLTDRAPRDGDVSGSLLAFRSTTVNRRVASTTATGPEP